MLIYYCIQIEKPFRIANEKRTGMHTAQRLSLSVTVYPSHYTVEWSRLDDNKEDDSCTRGDDDKWCIIQVE
jgi:hypothetical protein